MKKFFVILILLVQTVFLQAQTDTTECPEGTVELVFTLSVDHYGEETSWWITPLGLWDAIVYVPPFTYPNYQQGTIFTHNVCLSNGCYTLKVNDEWGDGLGFTSGYYHLRKGNEILAYGEGNFQQFQIDDFCIDISEPITGCTDENACNYNSEATDDDGSCLYVGDPCVHPNPFIFYETYNQNCDCDGIIPSGCTDENACNYDVTVLINDGSCEYLSCARCMDEEASNYDPLATISNPELCEYATNNGCPPNYSLFALSITLGEHPEETWWTVNHATDSIIPIISVPSGTYAGIDVGTVVFEDFCLPMNDCYILIMLDDSIHDGFTGSYQLDLVDNWTLIEGETFGSIEINEFCVSYEVYGCMDPLSCSFNINANVEPQGSCIYPGDPCVHFDPSVVEEVFTSDCECEGIIYYGCMDPNALNYDPNATQNDNSCYYHMGCTDENACNYDWFADFEDGSCEYLSCAGCMDEEACNYDPNASINNNSCEYESCVGCMDQYANNYDPNATISDSDLCEYNVPSFEIIQDCDQVTIINMTPAATEGIEFLWEFGDGTTVTSYDAIIEYQYQDNGNYLISLRYTQGDSVQNILSDEIVVVNNFESQPSLVVDGQIIICDDVASFYRWYKNDTLVQQNENHTLDIIGTGNYFCILERATCEISTEIVNVILDETINVSEVQVKGFRLFPTIVENNFTIIDGSGLIYIYNSVGELIREQRISNFEIIDCSSFASGVYFVRVSGEQTLRFFKK